MVARSYGNTQRGNRRHYGGQCANRDSGGRGLYRAVLGRMGLQKGRCYGRKAVVGFMCALYAATAFLDTVSFGGTFAYASELNTGYESAQKAFENGDYANALVLGKIAGLGGNSDAQVMVGYILVNGLSGLTDKNDAVDWYLKAARNGNTDAMVALAELALGTYGGLSASDSLEWLTKAADKGRTDAMRTLADIYILGKGTAPDVTVGRNWLVKASNFGDALAMRKLGDIYFDKNPTEAIIWYQKAAENGDIESAYIAAIMYAENFDIKPDAVKAAKLLEQAANAGYPAAQADYGLIVYQGNGVARSINDAAQWFKKSAEAGDPEGQFLYAFTLAKGEGVKRSYEDAYYWLLRAEQNKNSAKISDYDQTQVELKKKLEANVAPTILARARARALADKEQG